MSKANSKIKQRYKKQELVLGVNEQEKLAKATVAVVGLGALGSNCVELLVRAGVGKMIIIDRDIISLDNLQRQYLYDEGDVDKAKAVVCEHKLRRINSSITIKGELVDITWKNINLLLKNADCIVDCTDNLFTRLLLNDYAVKNDIPFVHGAVVGSKGRLYVVSGKERACLACIYTGKSSHETCDTAGVLNAASSVVSSLQANEVIKLLLLFLSSKNKSSNLTVQGQLRNDIILEERFIRIDLFANSLEKFQVPKNKNCRVCVKRDFSYLSGKIEQKALHYCGSFQYQLNRAAFQGKAARFKQKYTEIVKKLRKIGKVVDLVYCCHFGDLTLFADGRVLIKAKDEKEARMLFEKYIGG